MPYSKRRSVRRGGKSQGEGEDQHFSLVSHFHLLQEVFSHLMPDIEV
jgi:hypothetical protein